MYLYETHLHTSPVSACARVGVRETLEYYKNAGYAGVFITDHFIDGSFNLDALQLPYEEQIEYYFSSYEEGRLFGKEIGLDVFCGIEMSYGGTDFLVYGIDKELCLAHPDMHKLQKSQLLRMLMEEGALVIQAHPFREAVYIDHIRLFPRFIHGVEIYNANRTEFENRLAEQYCDNYGLVPFAGSDNHQGGSQKLFGGMATETPLMNERDFIDRIKRGEGKPFARNAEDGSVRYL
jgi:predicted metal-dependent phosphoesterase TrpH